MTATTDVQNVSICLVSAATNNYSIQCDYLPGSDAKGCVYVLQSGQEGVENVTGTIERGSEYGATVQLLDVSVFDSLLAFDWELDGSPGELAIIGSSQGIELGDCLISGVAKHKDIIGYYYSRGFFGLLTNLAMQSKMNC